MAAIQYDAFINDKWKLAENGGAWNCVGFQGSCTQTINGEDIGPIYSGSTNYHAAADRNMTLSTTVDLSNLGFNENSTLQFSYGFDAKASFTNGTTPSPMVAMFYYGYSSGSVANISYATSDWVQVRCPNVTRPYQSSIPIALIISAHDIKDLSVTLLVSNLFFTVSNLTIDNTTNNSSASILSTTTDTRNHSSTPSLTDSHTSTSYSSLSAVVPINAESTATIGPSLTTVSSAVSHPSTSLSANAEAGIIAGSLLAGSIIILIIAFLVWRRRTKLITKSTMMDQRSSFGPSVRYQSPREARPYLKVIIPPDAA